MTKRKAIKEIGEVWYDCQNDNIVLIHRGRDSKLDKFITAVDGIEIEATIPKKFFSPNDYCIFLGFF